MVRSRWLLGLSLACLCATAGCGWLPGPPVGTSQRFAHVVPAPEAYRGSGALTMRFVMPQHGAYGVQALASDIEHIDVTLTALGTIAVPPDIPLPMPASRPSTAPTYPAGAPKGMPAHTMPAPAPAPLPGDMEDWPTITPDDPPQGAPTPSVPAPPPPRLEKPPYQPAIVAQATVSRGDLDKGQGDVVFEALKAGVYGLQLQAYDRQGQVIGSSMQSVTVLDGQTAAVNTQLLLSGPGSGGKVAVGVTIVESGPVMGGSVGSGPMMGGSVGSGVATASPPTAMGMPPSLE